MKLTLAQLQPHLERQMASVYLLTGDEPLLLQEARDAIRQAAHRAGYAEHHRIATDIADWPGALYAATHSLSLLATRRFVEADLRTVRLTPTHTKSLAEQVSTLPGDVVLLLIGKRPDAKGAPPAWHAACDKAGVSLPVWPIRSEQFPDWIQQRAKRLGLPLSSRAARTLAEQTEGNLLAAAQELEKLLLWQGSTPATEADLEQSLKDMLADSARYDIFQLSSTLRTRDSGRALRILSRLLLAGVEPTLILWAITRECRALPKHTARLTDAARLDRIIKGAEKGRVSDALEALVMQMTDHPLPQTRDFA